MSDTDKNANAGEWTKVTGGCHCGAVRYEVEIDLVSGVGKCNCSICRKTNYTGARAKAGTFKLLAGQESLSDYQFNSNSVHHYFCKTCGVRSFGHGNIPQIGGEFHTVNVNCLDDVDTSKLRVRYANGRDNQWWSEAPAYA
jgi:hypothetical protein